MKLLQMLRIVMINILQNKVKVMLTSIGIIVGSGHDCHGYCHWSWGRRRSKGTV